jgi:hypothetical protein
LGGVAGFGLRGLGLGASCSLPPIQAAGEAGAAGVPDGGD